jgi:hypothetical protein
MPETRTRGLEPVPMSEVERELQQFVRAVVLRQAGKK